MTYSYGQEGRLAPILRWRHKSSKYQLAYSEVIFVNVVDYSHTAISPILFLEPFNDPPVCRSF